MLFLGKRAIFVPQSKAESYTETDRATKDVLYCIPIESNGRYNTSETKLMRNVK